MRKVLKVPNLTDIPTSVSAVSSYTTIPPGHQATYNNYYYPVFSNTIRKGGWLLLHVSCYIMSATPYWNVTDMMKCHKSHWKLFIIILKLFIIILKFDFGIETKLTCCSTSFTGPHLTIIIIMYFQTQ